MAATSLWHVKGSIKDVIDYIKNPEKTVPNQDLQDFFDMFSYVKNPLKTNEGEYVSAVNCLKETALQQMILMKKQYQKTGGYIAWHGYQSFKPDEATPEQCREIKLKLAKEMWGGKYQIIIATHLDKGHLHNHFCFNSVSFIDGQKYQIVERIFELAAHGYGAKKICHALAKDNVPVPTWRLYKRNGYKASMFEGKPEEVKYRWCIQTISNILANQIYLGHTIHYKMTKMSYKSKKNIKHSEDEWFVMENTHEPIVTQDLWDLVQTHVNSRQRSRKDDEPQIFSELIRCGECGWTLGSANTKDKGRFYRCTQYAAYGRNFCTLHYTPYKILYAFVLGRLQYWLMAVKENEDAILERLLQGSEKQRRSENARAEKELKKAQKRRQERTMPNAGLT